MRDEQIRCYFLTYNEYMTILAALTSASVREIPRGCTPPYRKLLMARRKEARLAMNAIISYNRQERRRKLATEVVGPVKCPECGYGHDTAQDGGGCCLRCGADLTVKNSLDKAKGRP